MSSTLNSLEDHRLTLSSLNYPIITKNSDIVGIHHVNESSTTTTKRRTLSQRDTDSSSTQDSGYSESTPYCLVQQTTPDTEHTSIIANMSRVCKDFYVHPSNQTF